MGLLFSNLQADELLELFSHLCVFLVSSTDVAEHKTVLVVLKVKVTEYFTLFYLLSEQREDLTAWIEILNKRPKLAHVFRFH